MKHSAFLGTCSASLLAVGLLTRGGSAQHLQASFGETIGTPGDHIGQSLAYLGDVNGDGADDLLIGAPYDDIGASDAGTVYVVSGVSPGTVLYKIHGSLTGDNLGMAVANIGDMDGDGVNDFVVGLPGHEFNGTDTGSVRVYSGATGQLQYTIIGPKAGARFGSAVAGGGDLDGDGRGDFIVGAPNYDPGGFQTGGTGLAKVYSGSTGNLLKTFVGLAGDNLGYAVAFVGDLDNDGRVDYAIGSPSPYSILYGGKVQVYSGINHALLFSKEGANYFAAFGLAIAGVGDTDDNGLQEVLVGAPYDSPTGGAAYLYDGPSGTLVHQFAALGASAFDNFGYSVAPLGDVNKDGHADFAIGAPMGPTDHGYIQTFSGKDDTPYLHTLSGPSVGDYMGTALSTTPGDINGDGWNDLMAGLPFSDVNGADSGLVEVFDYLHFQASLGYQGPGTSLLTMYGTELYSGGQADLRMQSSALSSPAYLVASISQVLAGFKGGVLVPAVAPGLLVPLATNALGELELTGIPGGNGPLTVYVQFVIKSASYPQGWGLSNALEVKLLP